MGDNGVDVGIGKKDIFNSFILGRHWDRIGWYRPRFYIRSGSSLLRVILGKQHENCMMVSIADSLTLYSRENVKYLYREHPT